MPHVVQHADCQEAAVSAKENEAEQSYSRSWLGEVNGLKLQMSS